MASLIWKRLHIAPNTTERWEAVDAVARLSAEKSQTASGFLSICAAPSGIFDFDLAFLPIKIFQDRRYQQFRETAKRRASQS